MNNVKALPLAELALDYQHQLKTLAKPQACAQAATAWATKHTLGKHLSWVVPQLQAFWAEFAPQRNCEDLVADMLSTRDLWTLGSLVLAKAPRRVWFVDHKQPQYTSEINPLVPVLLAAHLKYNNIKYSYWHRSSLVHVLDPDLAALVDCEAEYIQAQALGPQELLQLRVRAITPVSGPRAGVSQNPRTSSNLYHLANTPLEPLPRLARYQLLQTWCAHPQNRTKYQVLDTVDWDLVPDPLVPHNPLDPRPQRIDTREFNWTV
jgi:hypothetical protein